MNDNRDKNAPESSDRSERPARRRARSGRRPSRERRETGVSQSAPAYITRHIPYYAFLDEEALVAIENRADRLLEETGVIIQNDAEACTLLAAHGADVSGSDAQYQRVRFPSGLARHLCKTAPAEFVQHARNPARNVRIGGRHHVFAPVYGPPFVRDSEQGRRYGTIADFNKLVQLTAMIPWLHHSGGVTCEPCDVPVNKRHLDMVYGHLRYSDKPFLGSITERERADDSVAMAEIVFGADFLEDHCVVMGNVNINSPLLVDRVVTQAVQAYCGRNQGIIIAPFILGGAMGPVTTAGALVQAVAEAMVGVALSQAVKPGAPAILGNFLSSMNLRSGAPTFGMPEAVMSHYAIGQLARRLNLPLRAGGALTSSKISDAQAAYESADSMHSTLLGGANFVLHAAGWLEGGLVTGFEKLLLDADRLGAYHTFATGLPVDDNALAESAYADVAPGGHFLDAAHTLQNYETAYFEAALSNSDSFEQWQEQGEKSATVRAHERYQAMLKAYEKPKMDIAVDEALQDFVARRKTEMKDAWY